MEEKKKKKKVTFFQVILFFELYIQDVYKVPHKKTRSKVEELEQARWAGKLLSCCVGSPTAPSSWGRSHKTTDRHGIKDYKTVVQCKEDEQEVLLLLLRLRSYQRVYIILHSQLLHLIASVLSSFYSCVLGKSIWELQLQE